MRNGLPGDSSSVCKCPSAISGMASVQPINLWPIGYGQFSEHVPILVSVSTCMPPNISHLQIYTLSYETAFDEVHIKK